MNSAQNGMTKLVNELEARATQLEQEVAGIREHPGIDATNIEHTGEAGDLRFARNEREIGDGEAERDEHELAHIRAALARIHDGHYGICVDCDEPIAPARLVALPAATRCVRCQQASET